MTTADKITKACDEIKTMLLAKNKSYGDSALHPLKLFSKATPIERLKIRLDDKLNRILNGEPFPGDDDVDDCIGYLIFLKIGQWGEGPSVAEETAKKMAGLDEL